MVSVFLVVLQTSFSMRNPIPEYFLDEDWGESSLIYADDGLKNFKTAVESKDNYLIKSHLSILFPRLYKGQLKNNRYIQKNKALASTIKTESNPENLTGIFGRISLRRSLSQYRELLTYHFDCTYKWLEKRIQILNEAKTKEEQKSKTQDDELKDLLKELTLKTKVDVAGADVRMDEVRQNIENIKNALDKKTIPDNSEQNENTSGHTESDWFTGWLTKLITLKTKVYEAWKEVAELNKGRKDIADIKNLVKNKKEISANTKQIGEHVQKIVGINENSQLTKLTSDVIDYLKEIRRLESTDTPPVSYYDDSDDELEDAMAVAAF